MVVTLALKNNKVAALSTLVLSQPLVVGIVKYACLLTCLWSSVRKT